MHAARVLSLQRQESLSRSRSRRLQRGLTNGDLSQEGEQDNSPWYVSKWDERCQAYNSAKGGGLTRFTFHMFAVIALLGVGLMVGSLFVGPAAGLLEIGVSALLFSVFCLIFVRCDAEEVRKGEDGAPLSNILIPRESLKGKGKDSENNGKDSLSCQEEGLLSAQDSEGHDGDQSLRSLLGRSNPRKIPSPLRVFGYEMNFSPIPECSEPSSSASSFLTRNSSVPSRLANSSTGESLSRISSKASCLGGAGEGGVGSPINEELEDFDYDQQLQLKLDLMGPSTFAKSPDKDPPKQESKRKSKSLAGSEESFEFDDLGLPGDLDLLTLSTSNLSTNSASFDTDDSLTADLSVVTVVERKLSPNDSGGSGPSGSLTE